MINTVEKFKEQFDSKAIGIESEHPEFFRFNNTPIINYYRLRYNPEIDHKVFIDYAREIPEEIKAKLEKLMGEIA